VRFILGTPMVPGGFDDTRWDYDYYLKMRSLQGPARGHATIYFADNAVTRVDSDVTQASVVPGIGRPIAARSN
jgi:outer membrane protein assembly factor BamE (lipoprotein component of BamABCDE complex)